VNSVTVLESGVTAKREADQGAFTVKFVPAITVVALFAVASRLHSVNAILRRQQEQRRPFKKALTDKSAQEAFTQQPQCAEIASSFFHQGAESRRWRSKALQFEIEERFVLASGVAMRWMPPAVRK
jgi:hypothetical protein